jgi:PadR family transcriptional regulator, regulatory protein AphA
MTNRRTPTTYAILGLLNVQSWTTYELAKQVQRSINWFWPRAERKLYDEPKRLVADGLATATKETTGKRPRTVYVITDAGRDELRRWLDAPPAPPTTEFEGLVKLFFAEAGSLEQLATTLDAIAAEATERIDVLRGRADAAIDEPRFPGRQHVSTVCLRLALDQEVAVLRWVDWVREQVAQWPDAADPGAWDGDRVLAELAADARAAVG